MLLGWSVSAASRMRAAMAATASDNSIPAVRSRALAAVALFDHVPQTPQRELERIVRVWWEKGLAPGLKDGAKVKVDVKKEGK